MTTVQMLAKQYGQAETYAYLDEASKREIRRALLKAVAIPGYQVPFSSREMPVARGWGSGGLQITLSLVGPADVVKVIDQGDDASLNAAAMRALITETAGCHGTTDTTAATIVQSRHRIPEIPLRTDQRLVLQLPHPEPLRGVEPDEAIAARRHAEGDYTGAWLNLYDDEARHGGPRSGADHPILVEGRLMSPSPIPRYDVLRLNRLPHAVLLGAGRRARVTAIPPYTQVTPLAFADRPLQPEPAGGPCVWCGSTVSYRVPVGGRADAWTCTDTDACNRGARP
nr:alpha-D-ribose 1-methylphosphonate 5-phosphate C-P-lyase PhnJ [Streptomyces sp. NBC_00830]